MEAKCEKQIYSKISLVLEKATVYNNKLAYKKSLKLHKKAYSLAKQIANTNDLYYASILKKLGSMFLKIKMYNEATKYLNEALTIYLHNNIEDNSWDLFEIYLDLYNCYLKVSNYLLLVEYGIKVCEFNYLSNIDKAKIYANVARFLLLLFVNKAKFTYIIRALYYNTESKLLFEESNAINTMDYLYCIYDAGEINLYLEDIDCAIKHFEDTLQLSQKLPVSNDFLFALYYHLAKIYKEKGYNDTYIYYYNKANKLSS